MTQTVTALYDTYDSAASAVNALEAAGIPHSDISIVSNNVDNRYSKDRPTNTAEDAGKGGGSGGALARSDGRGCGYRGGRGRCGRRACGLTHRGRRTRTRRPVLRRRRAT